MRYITTSHLKTWAPERSCQDHLPLILRRLIYASPVTVKSIRFPAGSLIGLPGFDGQLEIEGIFPHIPNERSVWEIGTEKRHQDKATEDIKKRSNRAPSAEQKKLTYVFVTPYVWPKKDDWITKKMAVTNWKSIKVIDGEELEEWLEKLPSVGAFLAKYLGLPQGDVLPLDDFWHQWRQNENYTIPGSLITYGRESYVGKVTKVLTDSPNQGSYRLQSQEEALAFMAACIDKMDEPAKEKTFSRAVIVKDEDCFRRLSETKSPLILISTFPLDKLAAKALSNGHHVLEPLSAEYTVRHRDDIIDIPVVHRVGFEKALTEMGLSSEKVQKVT